MHGLFVILCIVNTALVGSWECTGGLEWKEKPLGLRALARFLRMVYGPPDLLSSSVEWAPIGLNLVQSSNEVAYLNPA